MQAGVEHLGQELVVARGDGEGDCLVGQLPAPGRLGRVAEQLPRQAGQQPGPDRVGDGPLEGRLEQAGEGDVDVEEGGARLESQGQVDHRVRRRIEGGGEVEGDAGQATGAEEDGVPGVGVQRGEEVVELFVAQRAEPQLGAEADRHGGGHHHRAAGTGQRAHGVGLPGVEVVDHDEEPFGAGRDVRGHGRGAHDPEAPVAPFGGRGIGQRRLPRAARPDHDQEVAVVLIGPIEQATDGGQLPLAPDELHGPSSTTPPASPRARRRRDEFGGAAPS